MRTLALLHVLTLAVSSANSNNHQSRPGPLWVTGGARKILYIISQISLYEMQSMEMIQCSSINLVSSRRTNAEKTAPSPPAGDKHLKI